MKNKDDNTKYGFEPTLNPDDAKILILGSFPGEKSLAERDRLNTKHQYYSNKGNQFWKVIFSCLNINDPKDYNERINVLSKHGICLWDLIHCCNRNGSVDNNIRNAIPNDFLNYVNCKIIINGKNLLNNKKVKYKNSQEKDRMMNQLSGAYMLPSTSRANTKFSYDDKLSEWKKFLN